MIDFAEHEGVSGLSVDDALKGMVILGANSQDLILSGQCPRNPLLAVPSSVLRLTWVRSHSFAMQSSSEVKGCALQS